LEGWELPAAWLPTVMIKQGYQRFVALMQFEIVRARQLYKEALPGIAMLSSAA